MFSIFHKIKQTMCQKVMFALQIDEHRLDKTFLNCISSHIVAVMFDKEAEEIDDQRNFIGHIISIFIWKINSFD